MPKINSNSSFIMKLSHEFHQFNITYEEITDKVEIGRGRFGVVYRQVCLE